MAQNFYFVGILNKAAKKIGQFFFKIPQNPIVFQKSPKFAGWTFLNVIYSILDITLKRSRLHKNTAPELKHQEAGLLRLSFVGPLFISCRNSKAVDVLVKDELVNKVKT